MKFSSSQIGANGARLSLVPAAQSDLPPADGALFQGLISGFPSDSDGVAEADMVLAQFLKAERPQEWAQFWALDEEKSLVVGLCGYKAAPAKGEVEIAYFTFPSFEGRGYATRMITVLSAQAQGSANTIIATTLPEHNASTKALQRCAFRFDGPAVDPEDGDVWRWSLSTTHTL